MMQPGAVGGEENGCSGTGVVFESQALDTPNIGAEPQVKPKRPAWHDFARMEYPDTTNGTSIFAYIGVVGKG